MAPQPLWAAIEGTGFDPTLAFGSAFGAFRSQSLLWLRASVSCSQLEHQETQEMLLPLLFFPRALWFGLAMYDAAAQLQCRDFGSRRKDAGKLDWFQIT